MAYVAEGGTLVLPPSDTFQSVCTSLGGTNAESYSDTYHNVSPVCLWNGMSDDDFWAAKTSLEPYCSTPLQGVWQSWTDPDYLGCEVLPG